MPRTKAGAAHLAIATRPSGFASFRARKLDSHAATPTGATKNTVPNNGVT